MVVKFRVLEEFKVLVLDLLTLGTLLMDVDEFGILFRTLDHLEELTTFVRDFCTEIRRIVVNALFGLVISHEIDQL